MCAVVLVAFNFQKKDFSIRCGLTDITSITKNKLISFFSAVYSPRKNLCIAQKQASLLITGALLFWAQCCGSTLSCKSKAAFLEGSLKAFVRFRRCTSTISPFFILMRCPAPFHSLVHERCKSSFQPSFFNNKKKKICGLLSLQKQSVCTLSSSCTHPCSWRPRLL